MSMRAKNRTSWARVSLATSGLARVLVCVLAAGLAGPVLLTVAESPAMMQAKEGQAGEGQAEERPASQERELERGAHLYRIHCLNCHGKEARGDGPMAPALKADSPDLTRLTRDHGGDFPREHVYQSIDGRFQIRSHGMREMPVWGLSFQVRGTDADQEREVQERLRALVTYLESVQRDE